MDHHKERNMVRWEYCRIMVRARPGEQQVRGELPVRVAGAASGMGRAEAVGLLYHCGVDGPPLRVLDDTIARLGHDGWELVIICTCRSQPPHNVCTSSGNAWSVPRWTPKTRRL